MPGQLWFSSMLVCLALCSPATSVVADPLAEIRTLTAQQQYEKAMLRLQQFLNQNPENLEANLLRGVVLTRQGDIDAAIAAFEQLATLHPALPEPHNNLAVLHASTGNYEQARVALLRALELQPRYDTAHENLGDLYAKLASLEYRKALRLNPRNERAQGKVRLLTQLVDHAEREIGATSNTSEQSTSPVPPVVVTQDADDATNVKTCHVIGRLLEEADAKRINQWFDERDHATRFTSRAEDVPLGFRVFIPPLESTEAADVQITRMRNEGVEDILRISGSDLNNAISLGVYSTEAAAKRRIRSLESMGYRPEITLRTQRAPVWYVGIVLDANDTVIGDFVTAFSDQRVREVSCN